MDEIHAHLQTNDPLEPLDNGEPGFRLTGLKDIEGTFSGTLDDGLAALLKGDDEPMTLYFYGPDPDLRWWERWFYRVRGWLAGDGEYPTVLLASGPAHMTFDGPTEDGDDAVYTGTFTSAGHWDFK